MDQSQSNKQEIPPQGIADKIVQALSLAPAEMLQEALTLVIESSNRVVGVLCLELQEDLLLYAASLAPQHAPGAFSKVFGFPTRTIRINLAHTPRLEQALHGAPFTFTPDALAAMTNNLLTVQQGQSLQETYDSPAIGLYPLKDFQGAPLGVLLILLRSAEFTEPEWEALSPIARLAALGVEQKQDQTLMAQQREQLAALHAASLRVSRSLDLEQVMQKTVEEVIQTLRVDAAAVSLIEPESGDLVIRAQQGLHLFAQAPVRIPTGKGVAWSTLQQGKTSIIDSWENEPRLAVPEFLEEKVSTTALIPLFVGTEPVGVLSAMSRVPRRFDPEEIKLLESIGDHVAIALANARLHQETRRQSAERSFLFNLAEGIAPLHAPQEIARVGLETTLAYLGWPCGIILIEDAASGALAPGASSGSRQTCNELLVWANRAEIEHHGQNPLIQVTENHSPYTAARILLQGNQRTLGKIILGAPDLQPVSAQLAKVFKNIGNYLGIAMENALLYQEMAEREQSTRALYQITRAMTGLDLKNVLGRSLEELASAIPYDVGSVALLEPRPVEVSRQCALVPPEKNAEIEERFREAVRTLCGPEHSALPTPERSVTGPPAGAEALDASQLLSYLEAPVMLNDQPVGAMVLARRRPFRSREQRLLFIVAYQLSNVLITIRLYQQAQQQTTRLRESDRVQSAQKVTQEQLLREIANELRAPVTFLQGYADLLMEDGIAHFSARQQQAARTIQQQAQVLSTLVHNLALLQIVETQKLQCQYSSLAALLKQALHATESIREKQRVQIEEHIPAQLPLIWADPERLHQALFSVLNSAINTAGQNGALTLMVSAPTPDSLALSITCHPPEGASRPAHYTEPGRNFEISLARRIIEAHRGNLFLTGQTSNALCFQATLPIERPAATE